MESDKTLLDKTHQNAAMLAVNNDHLELALDCTTSGSLINRNSAIMFACNKGSLKMVRMLVDASSRPRCECGRY
jgi:hypothetical protein